MVKNDKDILSYFRNAALEAINSDRRTNGLKAVDLSSNPCAQIHSDEMANERYMSHWNKEGVKPLGRYNRLGGHAYVAENIGFVSWPLKIPYKTIYGRLTGREENVADDPEPEQIRKYIKSIEYDFMYRDESHGNGHRDNILNRFHNYVSIGVSYRVVRYLGWNYVLLFMVQDFEDFFTITEIEENDEEIKFSGKKSPFVSISHGILTSSPYAPPASWKNGIKHIIALDSRDSYSDGDMVAAFTPGNLIVSTEGRILKSIPAELNNDSSSYSFSVKLIKLESFLKSGNYYNILLYDSSHQFPLASHTIFH